MATDHDYPVRLRVDHLLATPITYDWTAETRDADSEDLPWEWAETVECPKCRLTVVAVNGQIEEHEREDAECSATGDHVREAEGPQMNYWYPVTFPGNMSDAARLIADLPLCVVTVDGKEGIALTGGGMDLSWEICEAYMRLECAPPYHFASDLPDMSGRLDARRLAVLAACDRSIAILASWVENATERNANLRRRMSERAIGPANMAGVPADDLRIAEYLALNVPEGMSEEWVVEMSGVLK